MTNTCINTFYIPNTVHVPQFIQTLVPQRYWYEALGALSRCICWVNDIAVLTNLKVTTCDKKETQNHNELSNLKLVSQYSFISLNTHIIYQKTKYLNIQVQYNHHMINYYNNSESMFVRQFELKCSFYARGLVFNYWSQQA